LPQQPANFDALKRASYIHTHFVIPVACRLY